MTAAERAEWPPERRAAWERANAIYVDPAPDLSPDARFVRGIAAAWQMYAIETEEQPS